MMKRAKGGIVRYKSKPDDSLRAKYEHMMGGLTDIAPADFLRWKRKRPRTTRVSSGELEAALRYEDMLKISPRRCYRYFGLGFE